MSRGYLVRVCCVAVLCVMACAVLGAANGKSAAVSGTPVVVLDDAATVPATQRSAVPDLAAQAKAGKLIREVYEKEYAQRDLSQRAEFARMLIEQGLQTEGDTGARFVLFREARDIAAAAGDAMVASRAIALLDRHFIVDDSRMSLVAMRTAAEAASSPESLSAIAEAALAAADRAIPRDDYAAASRFVTTAADAATRAQNAALQQHVQQRGREVQSLTNEFERVQAASAAMRQYGQDPQRCLIVGRYLCFIKSDFAGGLPLLARSSDRGLRDVATAELAGPSDPGELVRTADSWWTVGQSESGLARRNLQNHAGGIYRDALAKLTGLERAGAEKRLDMLLTEAVKDRKLEPGLYAELFEGVDFAKKAKTRIDGQIDFDWGTSAPDEALPKDHFSIRWRGVLKVGAAGRYELLAIANAGLRVWVRDRKVVDEPALSRRRNGVRVVLDLPAGLHPVKIEYWDTTGTARMRLLWRAPGSAKAEPIPAERLYHDSFLPGAAAGTGR